jgi:hypothetical protein
MRDVESRLVALERQQADAMARLSRLWDRTAAVDLPPGVFWAKTVAESGSYPQPHASSPLAYPFIFCDGLYTEAAGAQAVTWRERSAAPHGYFNQAAGGYLWENSRIPIFRLNNRWWTAAPSIYLVGTLDGALALAGSATMSVYDEDSWTDTTWNLTVYASRLGAVASGKKVLAEWSRRRQKWVAKVWEC